MDNPGAAGPSGEDCCSCWYPCSPCCYPSSKFQRLEEEGWNTPSQQECIQYQHQIRKLESTVTQKEGEVDKLKQRLGNVQDKCTSLQTQNHDLKMRLSKLASEKMREGNACVEDLNDPLRPQAITEQWHGFFTAGEYWVAFELLTKSGKFDAETAQLLFRVCQVVYETCVEFIEELVPTVAMNPPRNRELGIEATPSPPAAVNFPELRRKLDEILPDHKVSVVACIESLKESVPASQRKLRSAVVELLRGAGQPPLLQEKVKQALQDKAIDVGIIEKFVKELTRLCFHMRLHEIPMTANFHAQSAHSQDPSLYDATGGEQGGAALVIRPPLLREEGGAVLCKGELQFFPSQASQQAGGPLSQQAGGPLSQQPGGPLSQQAEELIVLEAQQAGEPLSQQPGEPLSQQRGEPLSQQAEGPLSQQAGEPLSQQAEELIVLEAQQAGEPLSQQRGEPLSQQAGEPLSQQAEELIVLEAQQPGEPLSQQAEGPLSQQPEGPTVQEAQQTEETTVQDQGEPMSRETQARRSGKGQRKEFYSE